MGLYRGRFPIRDYPIFRTIATYIRDSEWGQEFPIRLMEGGGSQYDRPSGARAEHLSHLDVTRDVWDEQGITIYLHASISPITNAIGRREDNAVLAPFYPDGGRTPTRTRYLETAGAADVEPIECEGVVLGERSTTDRMFCFTEDFRYWHYSRYVDGSPDWSLVFDEAFRELVGTEIDEEARAARNIERFIAIARERNMSELRAIEQRISDNENTIVQSNQLMSRTRTQLAQDQELLDAVLGRREDTDDNQFRSEWEALQRHANIESVQLRGSTLHARTEALTMSVPAMGEGSLRQCIVGEYDLTIDFNTNSLNAVNLTNQQQGLDHPHVRNGTFCLGELDGQMHRLIRERQIAAAVNLAIEALKTVNVEDSWGRAERYWFDAAQDRGEDITGTATTT